jgi:hypothetical protein
MKRRKFSWLKSTLLLSLAGFFLYSASIQDIHYMFVHHDLVVNDHCNNHLHAKNNHTECSLCKIDLNSFVQTFTQFELPDQVFAADIKIYNLSEAIISNQFASISLRGPPATA